MNAIQKEFKSIRHKQQILGILVFTLVAIVMWVGISLVTSQQSTSISARQQQMALPLNPSINIDVLSSIEQQRAYDPSQLTSFPIYTLLTDEEAAALSAPRPATSSSTLLESLTFLEPSPTPEATESATASPAAEVTVPSPSPETSPESNPSL